MKKTKDKKVMMKVSVDISPRKRGDGKIEKFLAKEAISWLHFLLSDGGQFAMEQVSAGKRPILTFEEPKSEKQS